MAEAITSFSEARERAARAENKLEREKAKAEAQNERMAAIGFAVGARFLSRILPQVVPAIAGVMPMITIAGAGLSGLQSFNTSGTESAAYLGASLGLGMDAVDKVGDLAVTAIQKFKNK